MTYFKMFRQPYLDKDDGVHLGGEPELNDDDFKPEDKPTEGEVKEPEEPQEEFDEITYNKEPVKLSAKDRQKYLQMGYHFENKVQGKLTEYEQTIHEIQELTGLSAKDVIQQLRQNAFDAQVQQYVEANPGMSEEYAAEQLRIREELNQLKESQRVEKITTIRNQQRELLKNDFLFAEIDGLVNATLQQPTMANETYENVYNYIAGTPQFRGRIAAENSKRIEEERKLAEQRTIANIHDKKSRGIAESSDSEPENEVELTAEGKKMAAAFGNDPKDIAKYVKKQIRR